MLLTALTVSIPMAIMGMQLSPTRSHSGPPLSPGADGSPGEHKPVTLMSLEERDVAGPEVDVVFTWSAQPDYREVVQACQDWEQASGEQAQPFTEQRFRDMHMLRFSLRSITEFMPWFRQIFVVTDGSHPDYLRADMPNLKFISHKEIWDEEWLQEDLPTYNSFAIEVHLHRIPGLSEHFIYFNDDFLVGRPISKNMFFDSTTGCLQVPHPGINVHVPYPMTISCFKDGWSNQFEKLSKASHSRCRPAGASGRFPTFRDSCSDTCKNRTSPNVLYVSRVCTQYDHVECVKNSVPEALATFKSQLYDFITVNDNFTEDQTAFEAQNETVNEALRQYYGVSFYQARRSMSSSSSLLNALFPEPSEFELSTGHGSAPPAV